MNNASVLKCVGVCKTYDEGPQLVNVLNGVDLEILPAQRIAIVGASGSGKSTLLNLLGGLDLPTSGEVYINQQAFSELDENTRGRMRNHTMGFVYQFHHLLPEFTAIENVAMPLLIGGQKKTRAYQAAKEMLGEVGLENRFDHKPAQLSGGERQRVAIARALVNSPSLVLMDEPTGNLDKGNAESIQQLMESLSKGMSTSFVIVTHDESLASTMNTVYELADGTLIEKQAS